MTSDLRSAAARPLVGVFIGGAFGVLGMALLLIGTGHGAPSWLATVFLVAMLVAFALYYLLAYVPFQRLVREHAALGERYEFLERTTRQTLERMQAGDLAGIGAARENLPEQLAVSFDAATRSLASLVQQIQNSSVDVAGSGNTVHATASELASGSSQQSAAVVEITATMEELARTAAQIATNASTQAEGAGRAEDSGNAGSAAVAEAVEGVEQVRERIRTIASRADELGARSKEIYRVLDLITEIANETHILSLNASIEASAAGEHGKRFSVVADEVRRLAQRSRESVDSVRHLLEDFSASIRATVVATEEGTKEASRVFERARAASSAIEELRGALSETARAAREISLATDQQRTASDQVVLTLKEVSQVIQKMADGLKYFTTTAERLDQLALSIQLLTQSFHIDSPRSLKHLGHLLADDLGARADHWEALEGRLEDTIKSATYIELAYLVDAQGTMVAMAVNPEWAADRDEAATVGVGINMAERPWFQAVMRDGRAILTPPYDSLLTGERCFTVAVPVRRVGGKLAGVLGLDVNARGWTQI